MPRTPVIAGNWKMHTTLAEARALAAAVRDGCRGLTDIRVAVCPPFTALSAVAEVLAGSPVLLGAQDAHWEMAGPFTGCVSPAQIWDAGARVVILGHSERRHGLGETDDDGAAEGHGGADARPHARSCASARPPTSGPRNGRSRWSPGSSTRPSATARRARSAAAGSPTSRCGRSGPGRRPRPAQAAEVHARLRAALGRRAGAALAAACPILYGGSVKPEVTSALMTEPDIDGALVGGASLKAADFIAIVRAGLEAKGRAGAPAR